MRHLVTTLPNTSTPRSAINTHFNRTVPTKMSLIGCMWIATFHLCLQSTSSVRPRAQNQRLLRERPTDVVATLRDSGKSLVLATGSEASKETSNININTFAEILQAKNDLDKISSMGRDIAKSTLTAYLRKKIDQLYQLEKMLERQKKLNHLSPNRLSKLARPYFQSNFFKTSWKLSLSYTILINFGFDGKSHILFSDNHWDQSGIDLANLQCKNNEIYDQVYKKCRLVICKPGSRFVNGVCKDIVDDGSSLPNVLVSTAKSPASDIDSDMTLIILQANVTLSDFITTLTPQFKVLMIESLSQLLNISVERIKNFKIETIDFDAEPKRINVYAISNRSFRLQFDYSNNGTELVDSTPMPDNGTNNQSKISMSEKDKMKEDNSFSNIPIEISFVLVQSNDTSDAKSVSTIVQRMDQLVQTKEFTLNVNETSLRVVALKNEQEPIDVWCKHGVKSYFTDDQFSLIDVEKRHRKGQITEMIYINETNSLYETGEFDLTIFVRSAIGQEKANLSAFVFVCDSPKLKDKFCGRITLDKSEYKLLPNMSAIFGQYVLALNEYQRLENDQIVICIPPTMQSTRFFEKNCSNANQDLVIAQIALTLIFGVLSLFAMFAVLVTYTLFPKLRNIPGINTMNLTIALFCAELIFLLFGSVDSDVICTTVAISLHYFFLSSFFWMNVMSYDLYCTFGHTNILPWPRRKEKLIPRYLTYAWGAPALIVGLCSIIDFTNIFPPSVRVGYGMSTTVDISLRILNITDATSNTTRPFLPEGSPHRLGCWIQDPLASLIAFGVPLICIVLVNAVLFTRTIFSIRKTIKTINLRINNPVSGKNDVVLYVRMSVVMGFTWILGLASSLISSGANPSFSICLLLNIVGLFFVIFNCSQGLFICFVFVLNRRVAGYYKDLWTRVVRKIGFGEPNVTRVSVVNTKHNAIAGK